MTTERMPPTGSPLGAKSGRQAELPSVDQSASTKLLPFVLSAIAGSVDIIGFLGLDQLFTAHITGNIVILAARLVADEPAPVAHMISVPVFIAVLIIAKSLVAALERLRIASLVPLLLLQVLLLFGFLAMGTAAGTQIDPKAATMIFAGMLGVSAMALQNALVRVALLGAPSTAVMTTNITVFTMDVGEMLLARDPSRIANARKRAGRTWPAILGFLLGCILGGAGAAVIGLRSLVLPTGLALLALVLGIAGARHTVQSSPSISEERPA